MKKWCGEKFGFINQIFITLLRFCRPSAKTFISLNNEPSITRSFLIYLILEKLSQLLGQYPFMVNLDDELEYMSQIKQKM